MNFLPTYSLNRRCLKFYFTPFLFLSSNQIIFSQKGIIINPSLKFRVLENLSEDALLVDASTILTNRVRFYNCRWISLSDHISDHLKNQPKII